MPDEWLNPTVEIRQWTDAYLREQLKVGEAGYANRTVWRALVMEAARRKLELDSAAQPPTPPRTRFEVRLGIPVLALALFGGYVGVGGMLSFLRNSGTTDTLLDLFGVLIGTWGGFAGLRLLIGWRDRDTSFATLVLFVSGVASILGALWYYRLYGLARTAARVDFNVLGLLGIAAVVHAVRIHRRGHDRP